MENTNPPNGIMADERAIMELPSKLRDFLAKAKPFVIGEITYPIKDGKMVKKGEILGFLKPTLAMEDKDAIKKELEEINGTLVNAPLSFRIPFLNTEGDRWYLTSNQIEDGGPQPRSKIDLEDQKIQELYRRIRKDGQQFPIAVCPSTLTKGKYQIVDGHCRRYIIFNMLRKTQIWAVLKSDSKLQNYRNAFVLNDHNNFTDFDTGHYFKEVLMKEFPDVYPTMTAIALDFDMDIAYVSHLIAHYKLLKGQDGKLSEEILSRDKNLTEGQTRPYQSLTNEGMKTAAIAATTENGLSRNEGYQLRKHIDSPGATPESVKAKAKEIVENRGKKSGEDVKNCPSEEPKENEYADIGAALITDSQKLDKQFNRAVDKIVTAFKGILPELVTAIYGHLNAKGVKITPEIVASYLSILIGDLLKDVGVNSLSTADDKVLERLFNRTDLDLSLN